MPHPLYRKTLVNLRLISLNNNFLLRNPQSKNKYTKNLKKHRIKSNKKCYLKNARLATTKIREKSLNLTKNRYAGNNKNA